MGEKCFTLYTATYHRNVRTELLKYKCLLGTICPQRVCSVLLMLMFFVFYFFFPGGRRYRPLSNKNRPPGVLYLRKQGLLCCLVTTDIFYPLEKHITIYDTYMNHFTNILKDICQVCPNVNPCLVCFAISASAMILTNASSNLFAIKVSIQTFFYATFRLSHCLCRISG